MRLKSFVAFSLLAAWSLPAAAGVPGCQETGAELDLVTLNAWGLPAPVARDRRGRLGRITRYLEEHDFDVAGLQEVWRGALAFFRVDNLVVPEAEGDSGLALVTPHPVATSVVRTFRAARGFDRYKDKGVLMSEVDLPGYGAVHVFVTHLQAGGGSRNAKVRARQVDEILGTVSEVDGPVVLMGDFNFYAANEVDAHSRRRLDEHGLRDAAAAVGNGKATHPGAHEQFDRVYVRGEKGLCLSPKAVDVIDYDDDPRTPNPSFLSDHLPVRAILGLGRRE